MAVETIFDFNITLTSNADVAITIQGAHGYDSFSGSAPWSMSVSLGGTVIKTVGGAALYEFPVIVSGRQNMAAGSQNVKVTWYGASGMFLYNTDIIVGIRYK